MSNARERSIDRSWRIDFCRPILLNSAAVIGVLSTLFSLSAMRIVQAVDNGKASASRVIDIRVQANGFGGASPADIKAVLQSAAGELWRYCPNTQLPGIDVYHRADHPQTDLKRTPEGRIAIGLAVGDNHWAQYTFQFAHEYCHALLNYNNNHTKMASHACYPNLWLEESLCETASLFTLRRLSRSWLVAPPYPVWQQYAPWFSAYAKERLLVSQHHLLAGKSFIVWFRTNEGSLHRDGTRRDRNTIIAAHLLPIFEEEPQGWGILAFFSRRSNQSLAQQFIEWRSRCPHKLRAFIEKLAEVFDVQT